MLGTLDQRPMPERDVFLKLEKLERNVAFSGEAFARVGRSQFFTEFSGGDIGTLAGYMELYRAQTGDIVIREDDAGDFMLLIIEGGMDILKKGARGEEQHLTSIEAGMTLGEMSMIDGEPRFATCVATMPTVFAVLSRDSMAKIILDHPALGTKILVKLVTLLSLRLRQTSVRLLHFIDGGR
jgi:CRP/FNR family cyclic AMP-dependent transcriptional regulator